jgi:L-serine dehydratase
MPISVLDLFTIGIGPSSSHCVGPMRAAFHFAESLGSENLIAQTAGLRIELYGSLALTGLGHGTHKAVLLGLAGETPERVDPAAIDTFVERVTTSGELTVAGKSIHFSLSDDLQFFTKETLSYHSNGMRFTAVDNQGANVRSAVYYSVGGGFVVNEQGQPFQSLEHRHPLRYPYQSAADLLAHARKTGQDISAIALENESSFRPTDETFERLDKVWQTMQVCVANGCSPRSEAAHYLPGNLNVRRRAPQLHQKLLAETEQGGDLLTPLDWVDVYALAVSEENAAGGRVVTAPTNGRRESFQPSCTIFSGLQKVPIKRERAIFC